ncbi:MAG: hypothetical protein QW451_02715 [Candidatus Aenigmatarchaeota archaeon]
MKEENENIRFFQEQLLEAQQALFFARTIKQARFLQNKIKYLREKIKEMEKK